MNLRKWLSDNALTTAKAADLLGMHERSLYRYLNRPSDKLPRWLLLACWAIDRGANV